MTETALKQESNDNDISIETEVLDNQDGYSHCMMTVNVNAVRTGWIGVWDALKDAILGRPRLLVPRSISANAWLKPVAKGYEFTGKTEITEITEGEDE